MCPCVSSARVMSASTAPVYRFVRLSALLVCSIAASMQHSTWCWLCCQLRMHAAKHTVHPPLPCQSTHHCLAICLWSNAPYQALPYLFAAYICTYGAGYEGYEGAGYPGCLFVFLSASTYVPVNATLSLLVRRISGRAHIVDIVDMCRRLSSFPLSLSILLLRPALILFLPAPV
jgi:hypothetical protein